MEDQFGFVTWPYGTFPVCLYQGIRIKGREMALVWHEKASRTALQTSSLLYTHTLLVQTHNMITVKESAEQFVVNNN